MINRGLSGFSTRTALPLLTPIFPLDDPHCLMATVFFGANDASLPGEEVTTFVPLDEYTTNLTKILQHVKKLTKVSNPDLIKFDPHRILFSLLRPLWILRCGPRGATNWFPSTRMLALPSPLQRSLPLFSFSSLIALTEFLLLILQGVPFVNAYTTMIKENWMSFLCDGIHLSPEASPTNPHGHACFFIFFSYSLGQRVSLPADRESSSSRCGLPPIRLPSMDGGENVPISIMPFALCLLYSSPVSSALFIN